MGGHKGVELPWLEYLVVLQMEQDWVMDRDEDSVVEQNQDTVYIRKKAFNDTSLW